MKRLSLMYDELITRQIKKKETPKEYYKKKTGQILTISLIDLQIIIVAPFFGVTISDAIAIALISEIVGVFFGYCVKAFFGKREEEKNKHRED